MSASKTFCSCGLCTLGQLIQALYLIKGQLQHFAIRWCLSFLVSVEQSRTCWYSSYISFDFASDQVIKQSPPCLEIYTYNNHFLQTEPCPLSIELAFYIKPDQQQALHDPDFEANRSFATVPLDSFLKPGTTEIELSLALSTGLQDAGENGEELKPMLEPPSSNVTRWFSHIELQVAFFGLPST